MSAPNGRTLSGEFRRMVELAALDQNPDPTLSIKVGGIWELRERSGALLAEISLDGSMVTNAFGIDPILLERVNDLRAAGLSSRSIVAWVTCARCRDDQARDAEEVMRIALRCKA